MATRHRQNRQKAEHSCDKPAPLALSLEDAANAAGNISIRTLYRMFDAGLPFVQLVPGGRRLIRVADLDSFLASRRRVQHQDLNALVGETVEAMGLKRL